MGILRQVREQLGFSPEEVAACAGWSPARLAEIERAADIDEGDAERLGDLYGIDVADAIAEGALAGRQPVAALLKANAETLDAGSRFAIAEATTVAREIRQLQAMTGQPSGWDDVARFKNDDGYGHPRAGVPEALAQQVRGRLALGSKPVASVARSVLDGLHVVVLWEGLPPEIDAFSFASQETGAVIVANTEGGHMAGAFGRRVAFVHELCHLLFDRHKIQGLAKFCEIAVDREPKRVASRRSTQYAVERRARAFAAYFLMPVDDLRACWAETPSADPPRAIRAVMERFGVGYEAARSQLDNAGILRMDAPLERRVPTDVPDAWEQADPGCQSHASAFRSGVRPLRAGVLLALVCQARATGSIGDRDAAELLRVPTSRWRELSRSIATPSVDEEGTWRTSSSLDRA